MSGRDKHLDKHPWLDGELRVFYHWDTKKRGQAVRPYRLWDEGKRKSLGHRCFSSERNAHLGVVKEMVYAPIGSLIQIYDARSGRDLGTYRKVISKDPKGTWDLQFMEGE